jgi:ABC-type nitrate/sulfonate/bicarbonate transport system ATPase subunit
MLLEVNAINFKYPESVTNVFNDLTFKLTEPGFHSLFGPSGVGKTTLAKMISGIIKEYSGEISTKGMSQILYTYNLERLPGWYSVREHLTTTTPHSNREKINELVNSFGLQSCMNSRFTQLSLGQQNRTNLARYLMQDFNLLVMDESLANVDEVTKEKIILKIKETFPERGFLYISHNVVEVSKFCKQIFVLRSRHKSPQAISHQGQDYKAGQVLKAKELEHTMLEIVNAL